MLSNPVSTEKPQMLTTEEAASILGIKPATLIAWRFYDRHPLPFAKIGRCVRYRYSDVIDFIEKSMGLGVD